MGLDELGGGEEVCELSFLRFKKHCGGTVKVERRFCGYGR